MDHRTALQQATSTGRSHSLSARLSVNGRFQFLLIAFLLVTWSLTGAHNAIMAAPSTDPLNATEVGMDHAAMGMNHHVAANPPGDSSPPHDHCADHCLNVMLPVSSPGVASSEVTSPHEIQSAHWEPWRADLTPPPPKPGSFTTLS